MNDGSTPIDPNRISIEQAAKLLSTAYRERIEVESLQVDVNAGAPTNPDGTISLVNYAAWLAKDMGRGRLTQNKATATQH